MDGNAPSTKLQHIELRALRVWSGNPRRTIDPTKLDELASSIRDKGICVPLLVRPVQPAEGEATHEVFAGQRRLLAATKVLGPLAPVPCVVREVDDAEALELGLLENAARADTDVIEEAEAIERLIGLGRSVEQVADRLGHAPMWVEKRRKLLGLCDEARAWVRRLDVPLAHALTLATTPSDLQREIVDAYVESRDVPNSRDFVQVLRRRLHQLERAPFDVASSKLPGGSCAKCPKRSDRQMDLFGSGSEGAVCLDRACWQGKIEVVWTAAKRSAKKRQLVVIEDPKQVFSWRDQLHYGGPYVTAGDLPEGSDLAPVAVARTEDGHVVELFERPAPSKPRGAVTEDRIDDDELAADAAQPRADAAPAAHRRKTAAEVKREALVREHLARLAPRVETPSGALALFHALCEPSNECGFVGVNFEGARAALGIEGDSASVPAERLLAVVLLAFASEEIAERARCHGIWSEDEIAEWVARACGEAPASAPTGAPRRLALSHAEWARNRKGLLDAPGAALHGLWLEHGTQRVVQVEPGEALDAVLEHAAEYGLVLDVSDAA